MFAAICEVYMYVDIIYVYGGICVVQVETWHSYKEHIIILAFQTTNQTPYYWYTG